jgi:hypothetical protein
MGRTSAGHAVSIGSDSKAGGVGVGGKGEMSAPSPSGNNWVANEDELLRKLLVEEKSLAFISAYLGRPASSVRRRIEHLARQDLKAEFNDVPQNIRGHNRPV